MNKYAVALTLVLIFLIAACTQKRNLISQRELPASGSATVMILGSSATSELKTRAQKAGLLVTGDVVLQIHGPVKKLTQIQISPGETTDVLVDSEVIAEQQNDADQPDEEVYYLAKKEFGLPEYWKDHPTQDGRGVIIGILDDGVTSRASGLQTTSDGRRKLLAKAWDHPVLNFHLNLTESDKLGPFAKSAQITGVKSWEGFFDEAALKPAVDTYVPKNDFDVNVDNKLTQIQLTAFQLANGEYKICVDSNVNSIADSGECFGTFEASGEGGFWDSAKLFPIDAEFDPTAENLTLGYGERVFCHGCGVASVLSGYQIGGKFDGVAPGTQLVDFNLAPPSDQAEYSTYTLGKFIRGLEWLGQKKAEIVNISYSFYFSSAKAQLFFQKAFKEISEKYGIILTCSAGNNGPGVGSMNRSLIYPRQALVSGAFVSHDLDEYVYGTTGLPLEGRVISYSSRGPGSDRGAGPMIISPLASLAYANPEMGYWAFGGTSSASPAAGGLAAVMLSAIKENGWKKDPVAVVNAIRLSGMPLPNVAFVDQSYGLPKIEKALAVYQRLITGQDFAAIDSVVLPSTSPEGLSSTGVLLRTSEMADIQEFRVKLNGIPAPTLTQGTVNSLLIPVRIEYNHPWLRGANRLWLAVGTSAFSFEVLSTPELSQSPESLGEIRIIRDDNNQVLHVIPVTVFNNVALTQEVDHAYTLGAEEGKRFHLEIPTGLKGLLVDFAIPSGVNKDYLSMIHYNNSSVIASRNYLSKNQFLLPFSTSGWNQIALSRSYGTESIVQVGVKLKPIDVQLSSNYISGQAKILDLDAGYGDPDMGLEVEITEPKKVLLSQVVDTATTAGSIKFQTPYAGKGIYRLAMQSQPSGELSFPHFSCIATLEGSDGRIFRWQTDASELEIQKEVQQGLLSYWCNPNEHIENETTYPMVVSVELSYSPTKEAAVYASGLVQIAKGRNSVPITWSKSAMSGAPLQVNLKSIFGAGRVPLGEVKVY